MAKHNSVTSAVASIPTHAAVKVLPDLATLETMLAAVAGKGARKAKANPYDAKFKALADGTIQFFVIDVDTSDSKHLAKARALVAKQSKASLRCSFKGQLLAGAIEGQCKAGDLLVTKVARITQQ